MAQFLGGILLILALLGAAAVVVVVLRDEWRAHRRGERDRHETRDPPDKPDRKE